MCLDFVYHLFLSVTKSFSFVFNQHCSYAQVSFCPFNFFFHILILTLIFDLISRHIVHMSDIQTYAHDFLCMM